MVYVGEGLRSVSGATVEPALINPSLAVKRSRPDRAGTGMTYWPSYSSIAPECRAGYLEWLSGGRRDPSAYIGYVFLFFYGLERRAFTDSQTIEAARKEIPAIVAEVEQLLQVYSGNRSFHRYATQFLDLLRIAGTDAGDLKPPFDRSGPELPLSLRVGIGRIIAGGAPIPAAWALSWYWTNPETSLRTAARRCREEFETLFRTRYEREFGKGIIIKPSNTDLSSSFTPASASFGGPLKLTITLTDVATQSVTWSTVREIGESCGADLEAFSRWMGRNAGVPKTIGAVALLPPELVTSHDSQEASQLWSWVKTSIGSAERVACSTNDLLSHCSSFGAGKLAKSEAVLLAQLLEKGGFGIEPDVRFGGTPLGPGGRAQLFRLPRDIQSIASPQYAAATVLLHLAVAVSAADGSVSEAEEQHLEEHMERSLGLNEAERWRLSAHFAWLREAPPGLSGIKKRLESLDQRQRSAIADFIIGVAGADGQISPDEIRTLGKLYPMLGLEAEDVYAHVHAMAAGATPASSATAPGKVLPPEAARGYAIPTRPVPRQGVTLDMAVVKAKLAESSRISAILDDIFTEEEESVEPSPVSTSPVGKLPPTYGALLSRLMERPEWSREEFEAFAAESRLLPDAAFDSLNEAAFTHFGGPVLEGEDPIEVDAAAAKELLT